MNASRYDVLVNNCSSTYSSVYVIQDNLKMIVCVSQENVYSGLTASRYWSDAIVPLTSDS